MTMSLGATGANRRHIKVVIQANTGTNPFLLDISETGMDPINKVTGGYAYDCRL